MQGIGPVISAKPSAIYTCRVVKVQQPRTTRRVIATDTSPPISDYSFSFSFTPAESSRSSRRAASDRMPPAGAATGTGNGAVSRCSRVSSSAPSCRSAGFRAFAAELVAGCAAGARGCAAGLTVALHRRQCSNEVASLQHA